MAKKFDIGEFAKALQVSDLNTGREQIEYIDIGLIDPDPENFYTLSGLNELAENIALLGLQQPLRVRRHPDLEGHVMVSSGHRRRAALLKLIEEDCREDLRQVPCIRDPEDASPAMQQLRLIYANAGTRVMSNADLMRQAEQVEMLLYQLKEEGVEFPGRMRDHVAAACRVSAPKLARLKVIRDNLSADFAPDWEKGKLAEQTAYALARFPLEFQQRLFRVCAPKDLNGGRLESVLRLYEEGCRWEPALTCPDGSKCGAQRGDAALRHDLDSYDACKGQRCCLECPQATRDWSPCERMCSKAKAQRKDKKAEADAKKAKAEEKKARDYQEQTQKYAQRLLRAVDAADLADKVQIHWRNAWSTEVTAGTIRKFAAGDFENSGSWYEARLDPERLSTPLLAAKELQCSADFLLGLTEDIHGGRQQSDAPAASPVFCWLSPEQEPEAGQEIIVTDDTGYVEDAVYTIMSLKGASMRWDEVTGWLPHPGTAELPAPQQAAAEGWRPGTETPAREDQEVIGRFSADGLQTPVRMMARWSGGRWCFQSGEPMEATCVKWYPIPEED